MVNESEQLTAGDIWHKVSEHGKRLAISLAVGSGFSHEEYYLESVSQDKEDGFDLDQAMQDLSDFGVLEEISLIDEKREQLAQMEKPREIILRPTTELDAEELRESFSTEREMKPKEREYFKLLEEVKSYEEGHTDYPERFKAWDEPRYRLRSDFQDFVLQSFQ